MAELGKFDKNNFIERQFTEVDGGYYDEFEFFHTPNGSKNLTHINNNNNNNS